MSDSSVSSYRLHGTVDIDLSAQTVSAPCDAQQFYFRQGLRNLIQDPLIGFVISGVAWLIFRWLDGFVEEDLSGPVDFVVTLGWGFALLIAIINFPLWTYWGIKSFLISARPADMSTPESTVRAFLVSVDNSLYERGYNMLTDQARSVGHVEMPRVSEMAKKMPDVDIHDLESFRQFWNDVGGLLWKFKTRKAPQEQLGPDAVRLTVPVKADASKGDGKIRFTVEFVLVQRQRAWFLANGFVWPR